MKALTLYQPWASLMALGKKRFETRSWRTDYRGPLAIHAALSVTGEAQRLKDYLEMGEFKGFHWPHGAIVAIVDLKRCCSTNGAFIPEPERSFGDYAPYRYIWITSGCRRLPVPISCRGHQGLWNVPPELEAMLGGL